MKIYIELIVLIIAAIFFILAVIVAVITKKIAIRRYKPENDKSKRGEEERRARIIAEADSVFGGLTKPKESRSISPTTPESVGDTEPDSNEVNHSSRTSNPRIKKGFLRRRRK